MQLLLMIQLSERDWWFQYQSNYLEEDLTLECRFPYEKLILQYVWYREIASILLVQEKCYVLVENHLICVISDLLNDRMS